MQEEEEREPKHVNEAVLFFKEKKVTKNVRKCWILIEKRKREGKLEAFFKEEVKHKFDYIIEIINNRTNIVQK